MQYATSVVAGVVYVFMHEKLYPTFGLRSSQNRQRKKIRPTVGLVLDVFIGREIGSINLHAQQQKRGDSWPRAMKMNRSSFSPHYV